jgi:hypothetical protein
MAPTPVLRFGDIGPLRPGRAAEPASPGFDGSFARPLVGGGAIGTLEAGGRAGEGPMKRFVPFMFVGVAGVVTAGCPVFSDKEDSWCADYHDCQPGEDCYQWPCNEPPGWGGAGGSYYVAGAAGYAAYGGRGGYDAGGRDGGDAASEDARPEAAAPVACANPGDCRAGFTCGSDGTCHSGDCTTTPCINGFVCEVSANGRACVKADSRGCGSDAECTGTDACVDGICTPAGSLCSDRTQCLPGSACVEGKCVPMCGEGEACPSGFRCDTKGSLLCSIASQGCSITADCGSQDLVCVDLACVPRCTVRGPCGEGLGACVNNGCIPSQKIVAQCASEGVQGNCSTGQVCIRQHCYTSCATPDGGLGACTEAGQDICKTITSASGAYAVCGSTSNLGSECDLTVGKRCPTGFVCTDGFCKSG